MSTKRDAYFNFDVLYFLSRLRPERSDFVALHCHLTQTLSLSLGTDSPSASTLRQTGAVGKNKQKKNPSSFLSSVCALRCR